MRRLPFRCQLPLTIAIGMILAAVGGCTDYRGPEKVTNPDPVRKIPAIKKDVRERNPSEHDIEQMVKDLDSDDGAVRFYSIQGLRRLTGLTFGYQYFEDEDQRKPAIDKWKQWLAERKKAGGGK